MEPHAIRYINVAYELRRWIDADGAAAEVKEAETFNRIPAT